MAVTPSGQTGAYVAPPVVLVSSSVREPVPTLNLLMAVESASGPLWTPGPVSWPVVQVTLKILI